MSVLDLVIICMLSPLCMLLLHVALLLFWLCTATTPQTGATLGTLILRDCDPGLHREPLITHELSWAHYVSMNMNKWDRGCNCEQERERDWGGERVPDTRDIGREHKHEQAV